MINISLKMSFFSISILPILKENEIKEYRRLTTYHSFVYVQIEKHVFCLVKILKIAGLSRKRLYQLFSWYSFQIERERVVYSHQSLVVITPQVLLCKQWLQSSPDGVDDKIQKNKKQVYMTFLVKVKDQFRHLTIILMVKMVNK